MNKYTAVTIGLAFTTALSALALCACSKPPQSKLGARIERVDKEFDLDDAVTTVAIDNPWGEINIRSRDEREVGIHAVIQRLPPEYPTVEFRSRRDGAILHIDIVFAKQNAVADKSGRVDIAVYLPPTLALDLHTSAGRIAAKKRAGPITARNESGEIQASSYERMNLSSGSGQIRAIAIGKHWQGDSELHTDSGRIILLVPTFGDIALEAATGGKLSTNFGLSVHALPDGRHEAHARYGAGTSSLRAKSTSGEIVLEQLVLLGDHRQDLEDDD